MAVAILLNENESFDTESSRFVKPGSTEPSRPTT